jgi:hypothetical protein
LRTGSADSENGSGSPFTSYRIASQKKGGRSCRQAYPRSKAAHAESTLTI